jgi:hypothetical protein
VNDFNRLLDSSVFCLVAAPCIRQALFAHLEEVVAQEESSKGILDSLHHRNDIIQNLLRANLVALDIDATGCNEEVKSRYDLRCMLHSLVNINHLPASPRVVLKVVFEF